MNERQLFDEIMHYGNFDRMPVIHWEAWPETLERWYGEGLPRDANIHEFLGAVPMTHWYPFNWGLHPAFESRVLEETDTFRLEIQADGVTAKQSKVGSCIPQYVDYLLKDRSGWEEYRARLQPDPARLPADWMESVRQLDATATLPVAIGGGSMVGFTRNWMGVENLAMASFTDPGLLAEVADAMADVACWGIDQVLPHARANLGWGWEDICFRSGPLVSPDIFKQVACPAYRKVSERLRQHGCDLYLIDCDGLIDHLLPHWLDSGVNVMFPVEIGVWGADPASMRRKYGKELRILGGIDKLVLEKDRKAIDAEIERRRPLMAEGGFVPMPDHLITPDTPLDNYRYYLDKIRELRF